MINSWNNQIEAHKEANRRADAILAEEQKQFQAVMDANNQVNTGKKQRTNNGTLNKQVKQKMYTYICMGQRRVLRNHL